MCAHGREGDRALPFPGLNCIHNHLSTLYNNLSTESQSQWKRKYAGTCFCFSFCSFIKVNTSAGINTYKTQCCEVRCFLTTSGDRGHITLKANSHWPARVSRNTARLKASSDKRARGDFLEDRWAWRAWGTRRVKTLEGWRGRTQGATCRDKVRWSSFPSNSLEEQRGMVQKSGVGVEALEKITFSVVLSTLVKVTHILLKASGCQ